MDRPVKIVMLGAGGTGSYVAMHLYRLMHCLDRHVRIIIADGDSVEEKNLVRQHFTAYDLGANKAKALAERYAGAFKMEAEYIPDFIEDKARLLELLKPVFTTGIKNTFVPFRETVILIGCVDNNKSRRLCNDAFYECKDLTYIDSGNGEHSGQVVCGVRRNGRTLYKPIGGVYPDVLEDTDKFLTELSCAEASISAPQTIAANMTAATMVVNLLHNIIVLGDNKVKTVSFSTKTLNALPVTETKRKRKAA
jgi:molybdopterin/thiamine biosynthesis adenylyltransferase